MTDTAVGALPGRADRVTMRVIAGLAGAMALALAAGQATIAATCAWADSVTLSLLAEESLEVVPGAGVTSASIDSVRLTTDALAPGTRALFAVAAVLLGVTALAVGVALAWLLVATASGRPFRPALYRFSLVAGLALVLGPLLATALSGLASMQAAFDLDDAVGGILLPGFGVTSWGLTIPIVGLAVIALAYLLRRMEGLQRDTEGLV
ncbi:hypothetical protein R8Z57_12800 [Microbacterium sp. M3]|uniref:DUF2975 domain-containing protein n=1 Tax=Microbacterium arthrosphaerae TaxID=792652 RepID=A0ABU4H4I5_9MICO|nr:MULTISPECIES: hypothetical protein [Microbacterium]MDW4573652.1 hypothetical protein [Microbacterium arthrosphaerae]MDW7607507.1 hypothetical protein [Microbacterium sp. M3]